ncbi:MAG: hypothetical protein FJY97_13625 [candidate division Zixibacteria bacterium]|nr:hypothetical protein [candidate division Zixibacteria bacterium]
MPSWSTVAPILDRLDAQGLTPVYDALPETEPVEWHALPTQVDPTGGLMDGIRAQRKRWQVENMIRVLRGLTRPGSVIVDFGASSGNLGLPVAACFPTCQVYIVDKKSRTVDIAKERIAGSGLKNVALYPGFVKEVTFPFDVGLGLHLCGDATDQAQMLCIERGAVYIMAPCCIGFIQRSALVFPRSRAFSMVVNRTEYDWLASAADWTGRDEQGDQHRRGKRSMGYVNRDRNLAAVEHRYRVTQHTMVPSDASPKNEIIVGTPS